MVDPKNADPGATELKLAKNGTKIYLRNAISLVNSDNERDSVLLNRCSLFLGCIFFLEGLAIISRTRLSNNRSVMPLDVLGRTRATLN